MAKRCAHARLVTRDGEIEITVSVKAGSQYDANSCVALRYGA